MKKGQGKARISDMQEEIASVAQAQGYTLVEVTLQKEAGGRALCIYIDKEDGITLDDCERFHKAVQPLFNDVEYDYLEVSSPGADRPIKTVQDAEKHMGDMVEIKLFAKMDGVKQFIGTLASRDEAQITIETADGQMKSFPLKAVALVKPVITVEEE